MLTNLENRDSGRFIKISPEALKDNTSTHFDVYALVGKEEVSARADDFLLYAKSPYRWTLRELVELSRVGVARLYIREHHRPKYERYLKVYSEVPKVDPLIEPKFRIGQIRDIGAHIMEAGFLSELDETCIDRMKEIAADVVTCLQDDPSAVCHLQGLGDHDRYTYLHSVGVSVLATAIAMQHGESDTIMLREYALGGLLHDVGKKDTPLKILNKAGPLTAKEWDIMKRHPEDGLKALGDLGLSQAVLDMVGLHHEKMDGSGYPHGLKKEQIPIHVQIVTCADIFNALTTTRCYHAKRTRFEALMFMKHHLQGKISVDAFRGLVKCLMTDEDEGISRIA